MNSFTALFLVFLGLNAAAQWWLARRHIRHVRAHRPAVPDAFRDAISLSDHQKAADYTIARTRFEWIDDGAGVLLLLFWTVGGGLGWLDHLWRTLAVNPLFIGTAFLLSAALAMGLLHLPSAVYSTFVLEKRFGFNKTTPGVFAADLAKQTALLLLFGAPLILAALWLMHRAGALWWVYVWILWSGFSLLMVWIYPALIAPLFNKFTPLPEGPVRRRVLGLLDRTGFVSRGIFVMDGTRRTAHGNAYFTGLGRSKRIVFFDALLDSLDEREIEAVLAHELGHFKRHHVVKRLLLTLLLTLAGLAVLGWLARQPWFYSGLGIAQPSAHAALMLFLLVAPVFTFFLHPVLAWVSRRDEYEADQFASRHANARDLIKALVKLYRDNANTLTPDPLHSAFYDSHPPAPVRIAHLSAAV